MTTSFDPNAAAQAGSGIFGLPHTEAESRVVVIPVPFDATTSYRRGTSGGPRAVLAASQQIDLYDREVGRAYEAGIFMRPEPTEIARWNVEARAAADPIIERGGDIRGDEALHAALLRVNSLSESMNASVYAATLALLTAGKLPVVLGGDHSVPFGAIRAHAERTPGLGILHVDAHADLRPAYEGFTWSHASIMNNVVTHLPGVSRLVQVGIRDFSEEELSIVESSDGRIQTFFDGDLARERFEGATYAAQVARIIHELPDRVYVSFDIDGLDPALCPSTGTPVPGGLSFHEASYLVGAVARSGRKIVGVDLNEVAPGADEWDANVGARVLYKLIGWMLRSADGR